MNIYEVEMHGRTYTMQLSASDAARLGAKPVAAKASKPKNKSRKPTNKSGDGEGEVDADVKRSGRTD